MTIQPEDPGQIGHTSEPGQRPDRAACPGIPATVMDALAMVEAGLGYLNAVDVAGLSTAAQAEALAALGRAGSKYTAAHAAILGAFTAASGYETDGHFGPVPWLVNRSRVTKGAACGAVGWMRRLKAHTGIAQALAAAQISESWARQICDWTDRLPAGKREPADAILLAAASGGAVLADLAILATDIYERSRAQQADPDNGESFDDRSVRLDTTIGGAGRLTGDLTPACAGALQAVLDALGKNRGPEDTRNEDQRKHDALEEGLRLLIGAGMLPSRAGQPTRVQVHIPLSQLRAMPGASEAEAAWLAAKAGELGYLTGKDAEAAACDATVVPVVIGHVDWAAADKMTQVWIDEHGLDRAAGGCGCTCGGCTCAPPAPMTPEARARLRRTLLGMAVDTLSGPAGLASYVRSRTLGAPFSTTSLPLDIGYADTIPAHIRRAVILRDKHCQWAGGCDRPAVACQVHHLVRKADGGKTSVRDCILLCDFHHLVCIHQWGWSLILHPDGTTEAKSPWGQILRSHGPPARAG